MANTSGITQSLPPSLPRYTDVQNAAKPVQDEMGQQAFLKLFTTQLQNQNPLDPVKNEAFVAQLAQFSQLEAITKMSSSMDSLVTSLQGQRLSEGAALIGKKVAAPRGSAELVDGGSISGLISVPSGASQVRLDVYDMSGNKVFTQSLGRQAPGDVTVRWDGRNASGAVMPPGRYNMIATVDAFGQITQIPISTPATVVGVNTGSNNELVLEIEGGATVPLSQVRRIGM
jgi:flagellar basal-body rod modification protein FlgD